MLFINLLALLSLAVAYPAISTLSSRDASTAPPDITADMIIAISPKSSTCANPPAPKQCMTAQSLAGLGIKSIANQFGITSKGEIAAALSTMAYESGDFKYNHNVYPGRPGQGTRNMQFSKFNTEYATFLAGKDNGFKSSLAKVNMQDVDAVLALINSYPVADVGSAFWFIANQANCAPVRQGLQAGTLAGWQAYVTTCLGTDPSDAKRQDYWEAACKALGC